MSSPHDKLAKAVFSQLEHAASELSAILPRAIVESIDWGSLSLVSGEFVDAPLAHLHSDLLYTATLGDSAACIYVLFEHMSTVEHGMTFRLLRYMTRIWERFERDAPGAPLPVIIPVVLHHSDKGWSAPVRFADLFQVSNPLRPAVSTFIPDFGFVLDDLSKLDDEALRSRAVTELVRLTLVALQRCRKAADPVAVLRPWASTLVAVLTSPKGVDALSAVARYIMETTEGRAKELGAFLRELGPKAEEAYVTAAEELRAQGRAEGRAEGQAALLLRLLSRRFGAVPEVIRARVQGATCTQLEAWAERVLSVSAVEELFDP